MFESIVVYMISFTIIAICMFMVNYILKRYGDQSSTTKRSDVEIFGFIGIEPIPYLSWDRISENIEDLDLKFGSGWDDEKFSQKSFIKGEKLIKVAITISTWDRCINMVPWNAYTPLSDYIPSRILKSYHEGDLFITTICGKKVGLVCKTIPTYSAIGDFQKTFKFVVGDHLHYMN